MSDRREIEHACGSRKKEEGESVPKVETAGKGYDWVL